MGEKPLVFDLYCGLGGWAEGFLSEGYRVIGFDIQAHDYGTGGYPGELVLRDMRSLSGAELVREYGIPAVIVGSSPCQEFSYRAMPWKRAKALPPPYLGMELFQAQFRIQREVSEAAGQYVSMVVENVRGAQKWVGRARGKYGSFYLWGDLPALMPVATVRNMKSMENTHARTEGPNRPRFICREEMHVSARMRLRESGNGSCACERVVSCAQLVSEIGGELPGASRRTKDGVKQSGISGVRENGKGDRWFQDGAARHGSKSNSRKAASAMIAKIPFPLAQHIARCFDGGLNG
jgi:hypothetical protein